MVIALGQDPVAIVFVPTAGQMLPMRLACLAIIWVAQSVGPKWSENRMIISVASGKGGTGKTLVATSLALSLGDIGKVQLLDCDVEEPNANIFVHLTMNHAQPVRIPIPKVDSTRCSYCGTCAAACAYNAVAVVKENVLVFPELCHGCGACSYLCPESAISEDGRDVGVVQRGQCGNLELIQGRLNVGEAMAPPVIREVKKHVDPQAITIIDVPPGTSCPVVEAIKGSDFCLLVTEPTPFGLNDLSLAVEVARMMGISFAVVINRAGIGNDEVEQYCQREGIPVLLTIPLDRSIALLYSKGTALVEDMPQWHQEFLGLFHNIKDLITAKGAA